MASSLGLQGTGRPAYAEVTGSLLIPVRLSPLFCEYALNVDMVAMYLAPPCRLRFCEKN